MQPDNFWHRVRIGTESECWPWCNAKDEKGYGTLYIGEKHKFAHRYAYEVTYGAIPDGMKVLHTCNLLCCCNPSHLFLGDWAESGKNRIRRGRQKNAWGDKSPNHVLTEEKAIALFKDTGTYAELGRKYGCDEVTAARVKKRQSWTKVTANL
jgi:hypothetical protein